MAGEGKDPGLAAGVALVTLNAHGGGAETDEDGEDGVDGPVEKRRGLGLVRWRLGREKERD